MCLQKQTEQEEKVPKDTTVSTDTGEVKENAASKDASLPKHTSPGIRATQGIDELAAQENSGQKGSAFQHWNEENVFDQKPFHGKGHRLTVLPEDNEHLDELGDGVGISKSRRQSDSFIDDYGEIYEFKAGYRTGGIDRQQAYEYSLMQEAEKVYVRQEDNLVVEVPVKGVTYIFDSPEGANANRAVLEQYGFGILYRDEQGKLQQLDE